MNINKAIIMAAGAHEGQKRKLTGTPYITHPFAVGMMLSQAGCDDDTVIAGILHDTVEDTYIEPEDIKKDFGENVKNLVAAVSEPDRTRSWKERKTHTIESMKTADRKVLMIICADKFHNLSEMYEQYKIHGEKIWNHFKNDMESQMWYYKSISDVFTSRPGLTSDIKLSSDYRLLVDKFSEELRNLYPKFYT